MVNRSGEFVMKMPEGRPFGGLLSIEIERMAISGRDVIDCRSDEAVAHSEAFDTLIRDEDGRYENPHLHPGKTRKYLRTVRNKVKPSRREQYERWHPCAPEKRAKKVG